MPLKKFKRAVKKITRPIAKVLDKVVPNEVKPFLPYAAAAFPFLAPGAFGTLSATMPGFGIQNAFLRAAAQRGLTGSGLNIFSQLAQEGSEGDINLTRAAIAGIPAALATPGLAENLGVQSQLVTEGAVDPTAFGTQLKSGSLDLLSKAAGAAEKGASADLFSMGKAKAIATPLSLEGTFDAVAFAKQAEADYLAELAEFNRMAGEQREASDADRRAHIIASMTRANFTEDVIDDTLDQLGLLLKDGGRVGLQEGGLPTVESLGGSGPNVRGGSIVYDLGNGEYIYRSPVGFELIRDGVYTSLGSGEGSAQTLEDLFDRGILLRRADDPILLAQQAANAPTTTAPSIIGEDLKSPATTTAPTPTGIQTIPGDKKVFNVMLDEKGNMMKDQSLLELFRETGTAPEIGIGGPVPIRSISDVFRLAGITGEDSVAMGTDYQPGRASVLDFQDALQRVGGGTDAQQQAQTQDFARNEANRLLTKAFKSANISGINQKNRSGIINAMANQMLPANVPTAVMPPSNTAGMRGGFAEPVTLDGQQFTNEADAIAALGIERYNQLMADGGIASFKDGGIMDLGGKEMDMRTGGFIPIGAKERADDVPARLSKNEFVMTADAVRAAGGGSVNKGAKRMYDLMHNLEARA
jgi:hypothetical protein